MSAENKPTVADKAAGAAQKAADVLRDVAQDAAAATAPPDPNPAPRITPQMEEAAAEFESAVDAPAGPAAPTKIHVAARVYGVLLLVSGVAELLFFALLLGIVALVWELGIDEVSIGEHTTLALALMGLSVAGALANGVLSVMLGRSLFKSRRRRVAQLARVLAAVIVAQVVLSIMLSGVSASLWKSGVQLAVLIALSVGIDPTLARERRVERAIDKLENAEDVAQGLEGRDRTGKGYLSLNFFTLFWEFMACCVLGLVLEVIWHAVVVDPGAYQDRAGLLFGPFSPIYGFGAVLITLALNRLYNKNIVVIFLVSAVVGGAFEAFVSLFMQLGFGATAWDYSSYTVLGFPDPIAALAGGRTSTMFCCIWGLLGLVWVKAFLPLLLKAVNLIPWKLRYGLTAVCCALMLVNGVMTLGALDCWFERVSGVAPQTTAGEFFAEYFPDDYMQNRFQSMTIAPEDSTRLTSSTSA